MKRTISLLSVLALILAFSSSSFAQPTQTVTTTAEVQQQITLTKNQDINFGTVQATSNPDLVPGGTNTDVGSDADVGKITVSANSGTQLVVDWNQATVTLENASADQMTFTPDVNAGQSDNTDGTNSSDVTKGTASSATETDGSGNLYIYIGGDLGTLNSQATGTYTSSNGSGDLQFTVNYQ